MTVVMKVLKCWCNGWASSRRYHEEPILPCLFGCSHAQDDLHHYMMCPHLFGLWTFLTPGVNSNPLIRWALVNPTEYDFLLVACVFSGYHALRRKLKYMHAIFQQNQPKICNPLLRVAWTVLADAFCVEARELNVPFKQFSVASFLDFICNQGEAPDCLCNAPFERDVPVSLRTNGRGTT